MGSDKHFFWTVGADQLMRKQNDQERRRTHEKTNSKSREGDDG